MAGKDTTTQGDLPFGTIDDAQKASSGSKPPRRRATKKRSTKARAKEDEPEGSGSPSGASKGDGESATASAKGGKSAKKSSSRKPRAETAETSANSSSNSKPPSDADSGGGSAGHPGDGEGGAREGRAERRQRYKNKRRQKRSGGQGQSGQGQGGMGDGEGQAGQSQQGQNQQGPGGGQRKGQNQRKQKKGQKPGQHKQGHQKHGQQNQGQQKQGQQNQGQQNQGKGGQPIPASGGGMFILEKGGIGVLRSHSAQWCPSKEDIYVPKRLIQKYRLFDGALVEGRLARGQKHKFQLVEVDTIDGYAPDQLPKTRAFKALTSIDPDFHYATGDSTDNVSMRIVDLLCPIGRGQRGLIVAPPRTGKTTLMREFAHGIETTYPEVHLFVLLIDERPEEATEWRRSVDRAQVFVSTADETAKHHIQVAEAVWRRCMRLVELGEDVVLLLDSITRLARAYNNQLGGGGKIQSGGLDSRAMERPRKIFGSARNTESAGSLTILGTTLIETGSQLDRAVFEEFKGTGNMELVLSRKLADRRIFPAIDVERSGTRKEEKLVGMRRLKLLHTLRRVLGRMNFIEAMELLITRLDDVEKTDDFLSRFEVDPEA